MSDTSNNCLNNPQWFALWVYRNQTSPIVEMCSRAGEEYYIPVRIVERYEHEQLIRHEEPVISGLIFIRTSVDRILEIQRSSANRAIPYRLPGTSQPAAIDDRTMETFIFVTRTGARQLEAAEFPIDKGDRVRVTDGLFKGAEGYIRRVHGTRRFVVAIEGVVAVAVTHIPRQYLEKIGPANS